MTHDVSGQQGVSLLEAIISIAFLVTIISVFSLTLSAVMIQQRSIEQSQAVSFAQAQLEALANEEYDTIPVGMDLQFYNFPYNHGKQTVQTDENAQNGTQSLQVSPGVVLDANVSSIVLQQNTLSQDFTYTSYVRVEPGAGAWELGPVFDYRDNQNYYQFRIDASEAEFIKVQNGVEEILAITSAAFSPGQWYKLEVLAVANVFTISIDNLPWDTIADNTFATGKVGYIGYTATSYSLDQIAIVSSYTNEVCSFESESVGDSPLGFIGIAPSHLNSLRGSIDIENPGGLTSAKQITAKVTWSSKSNPHIAEVTTMVYEPAQ